MRDLSRFMTEKVEETYQTLDCAFCSRLISMGVLCLFYSLQSLMQNLEPIKIVHKTELQGY